jgi:hypothetical protein
MRTAVLALLALSAILVLALQRRPRVVAEPSLLPK